MSLIDRRTFITASGAGALLTSVPGLAHQDTGRKRPIKRALKYGMIGEGSTIMEKFQAARDVGFEGVEMDSPSNLDANEILEAKQASGIEIPGVVDSIHWTQTLGDPSPKVRAKGLKGLLTGLRDCKTYGGTTVLLVPGVVNEKMPYHLVYERSQAEIRKALPLAQELGIKIAFENVWNNFLLSPVEAARYVDEFESDHVGWFFDVGNVVRYGWPAHWVQALGKRILKLDVKEYSREKQMNEGPWKGFSVKIGDGDCSWPEVMAALDEVEFEGWASAEVGGGGRERMAEVLERMTRALDS